MTLILVFLLFLGFSYFMYWSTGTIGSVERDEVSVAYSSLLGKSNVV